MNKDKTESVAAILAGMLAQYLENNWVNSPSAGKPIDTDTNMVTGLQLDSFQVMEFMLEVEDYYDVEIYLDILSNIETISDLSAVVIQPQQD